MTFDMSKPIAQQIRQATKKDGLTLLQMTDEVGEWLESRGWNDNRTCGDEVALLCSEAIEALEAFRAKGFVTWTVYQPVIGTKMPKLTELQCEGLARALGIDKSVLMVNPRREGVGPELAGLLVRLLDTCQRHGFDLEEEYRKEMDYNWTRPYRNGGKAI